VGVYSAYNQFMKIVGQAIKETIFQFAVLHIVLIAYQAIRTGDLRFVHLASIMNLTFFFEDISFTLSSNLLLFVPVVLLLLVNFVLLRRQSPK